MYTGYFLNTSVFAENLLKNMLLDEAGRKTHWTRCFSSRFSFVNMHSGLWAKAMCHTFCVVFGTKSIAVSQLQDGFECTEFFVRMLSQTRINPMYGTGHERAFYRLTDLDLSWISNYWRIAMEMLDLTSWFVLKSQKKGVGVPTSSKNF